MRYRDLLTDVVSPRFTMARQAAFAVAVVFAVALTASAKEQWKALVMPASINKDQTVKLVAGHTQPITLMLQASKKVREQADSHDVEVELNFPKGFDYLDEDGKFKTQSESTRRMKDGRRIVDLHFKVKNHYIVGSPGSRARSSWKAQTIYVRVPPSVPWDQRHLTVTVKAGKVKTTQLWRLALSPLKKKGEQPDHIRIGLWAYTLHRGGQNSSPGLARFLKEIGVTYIQKSSGTLRKELVKQDVICGGAVHQSYFSSSKSPKVNVHGKRKGGGYPDPTGIIEQYKPKQTPGVDAMVKHAKKNDGIATLDYEPHSNYGFADNAVKAFKKKSGVSDEAFKHFRDYFAKHGKKKFFHDPDPAALAIYRKWVAFRTDQTAAYIRQLSKGFHAKLPDGRFGIVPNDGFEGTPAGAKIMLGYGVDGTAYSPYVDEIMPMVYNGYGSAAAKQTMNLVRGWRVNLDHRQVKTRFDPLLLVRYAGASVKNSPARMRQQMIGAVAEGADGFVIYYPGQMDAPYWINLAQTTRWLSQYENFYMRGKRVDQRFKPTNMPSGQAQVNQYPGFKMTVDQPQWNYTAHQYQDKVLLTLFNLQSASDLVFTVDAPSQYHTLNATNVKNAMSGHKWLIGPKQVGFVVLGPNGAGK